MAQMEDASVMLYKKYIEQTYLPCLEQVIGFDEKGQESRRGGGQTYLKGTGTTGQNRGLVQDRVMLVLVAII